MRKLCTDNSQQMFDKVAKHLLTQNAKSRCLYRSQEGMMCAIGCLIPDDLYSPNMEGIWVERLVAYFPELEKFIPDLALADRLQSIHDVCASSRWRGELRRAAKDFHLSDKILKRF